MNYTGTIKDVGTYEPRFTDAGENGFDIMFTVNIPEVGDVEVYQEVSERYGVGKNASKTNIELTWEILDRLGFNGGQDLSRLPELIGNTVQVYCSERTSSSGTTYKTWYFSTAYAPKKIDAASRMANLMKSLGSNADSSDEESLPF